MFIVVLLIAAALYKPAETHSLGSGFLAAQPSGGSLRGLQQRRSQDVSDQTWPRCFEIAVEVPVVCPDSSRRLAVGTLTNLSSPVAPTTTNFDPHSRLYPREDGAELSRSSGYSALTTDSPGHFAADSPGHIHPLLSRPPTPLPYATFSLAHTADDNLATTYTSFGNRQHHTGAAVQDLAPEMTTVEYEPARRLVLGASQSLGPWLPSTGPSSGPSLLESHSRGGTIVSSSSSSAHASSSDAGTDDDGYGYASSISEFIEPDFALLPPPLSASSAYEILASSPDATPMQSSVAVAVPGLVASSGNAGDSGAEDTSTSSAGIADSVSPLLLPSSSFRHYNPSSAALSRFSELGPSSGPGISHMLQDGSSSAADGEHFVAPTSSLGMPDDAIMMIEDGSPSSMSSRVADSNGMRAQSAAVAAASGFVAAVSTPVHVEPSIIQDEESGILYSPMSLPEQSLGGMLSMGSDLTSPLAASGRRHSQQPSVAVSNAALGPTLPSGGPNIGGSSGPSFIDEASLPVSVMSGVTSAATGPDSPTLSSFQMPALGMSGMLRPASSAALPAASSDPGSEGFSLDLPLSPLLEEISSVRSEEAALRPPPASAQISSANAAIGSSPLAAASPSSLAFGPTNPSSGPAAVASSGPVLSEVSEQELSNALASSQGIDTNQLSGSSSSPLSMPVFSTGQRLESEAASAQLLPSLPPSESTATEFAASHSIRSAALHDSSSSSKVQAEEDYDALGPVAPSVGPSRAESSSGPSLVSPASLMSELPGLVSSSGLAIDSGTSQQHVSSVGSSAFVNPSSTVLLGAGFGSESVASASSEHRIGPTAPSSGPSTVSSSGPVLSDIEGGSSPTPPSLSALFSSELPLGSAPAMMSLPVSLPISAHKLQDEEMHSEFSRVASRPSVQMSEPLSQVWLLGDSSPISAMPLSGSSTAGSDGVLGSSGSMSSRPTILASGTSSFMRSESGASSEPVHAIGPVAPSHGPSPGGSSGPIFDASVSSAVVQLPPESVPVSAPLSEVEGDGDSFVSMPDSVETSVQEMSSEASAEPEHSSGAETLPSLVSVALPPLVSQDGPTSGVASPSSVSFSAASSEHMDAMGPVAPSGGPRTAGSSGPEVVNFIGSTAAGSDAAMLSMPLSSYASALEMDSSASGSAAMSSMSILTAASSMGSIPGFASSHSIPASGTAMSSAVSALHPDGLTSVPTSTDSLDALSSMVAAESSSSGTMTGASSDATIGPVAPSSGPTSASSSGPFLGHDASSALPVSMASTMEEGDDTVIVSLPHSVGMSASELDMEDDFTSSSEAVESSLPMSSLESSEAGSLMGSHASFDLASSGLAAGGPLSQTSLDVMTSESSRSFLGASSSQEADVFGPLLPSNGPSTASSGPALSDAVASDAATASSLRLPISTASAIEGDDAQEPAISLPVSMASSVEEMGLDTSSTDAATSSLLFSVPLTESGSLSSGTPSFNLAVSGVSGAVSGPVSEPMQDAPDSPTVSSGGRGSDSLPGASSFPSFQASSGDSAAPFGPVAPSSGPSVGGSSGPALSQSPSSRPQRSEPGDSELPISLPVSVEAMVASSASSEPMSSSLLIPSSASSSAESGFHASSAQSSIRSIDERQPTSASLLSLSSAESSDLPAGSSMPLESSFFSSVGSDTSVEIIGPVAPSGGPSLTSSGPELSSPAAPQDPVSFASSMAYSSAVESFSGDDASLMSGPASSVATSMEDLSSGITSDSVHSSMMTSDEAEVSLPSSLPDILSGYASDVQESGSGLVDESPLPSMASSILTGPVSSRLEAPTSSELGSQSSSEVLPGGDGSESSGFFSSASRHEPIMGPTAPSSGPFSGGSQGPSSDPVGGPQTPGDEPSMPLSASLDDPEQDGGSSSAQMLQSSHRSDALESSADFTSAMPTEQDLPDSEDQQDEVDLGGGPGGDDGDKPYYSTVDSAGSGAPSMGPEFPEPSSGPDTQRSTGLSTITFTSTGASSSQLSTTSVTAATSSTTTASAFASADAVSSADDLSLPLEEEEHSSASETVFADSMSSERPLGPSFGPGPSSGPVSTGFSTTTAGSEPATSTSVSTVSTTGRLTDLEPAESSVLLEEAGSSPLPSSAGLLSSLRVQSSALDQTQSEAHEGIDPVGPLESSEMDHVQQGSSGPSIGPPLPDPTSEQADDEPSAHSSLATEEDDAVAGRSSVVPSFGPGLDVPPSSGPPSSGPPSSGPSSTRPTLTTQVSTSTSSTTSSATTQFTLSSTTSTSSTTSSATTRFSLSSTTSTSTTTSTITSAVSAASSSSSTTTSTTTLTVHVDFQDGFTCELPDGCSSRFFSGCGDSLAPGGRCVPEVLGGLCVEVEPGLAFSCPWGNNDPEKLVDLEGSLPTVVCQVCAVSETFVDVEVEPGVIAGELRFGPNYRQSTLYETTVMEYRVYLVDNDGNTVGNRVATVAASSGSQGSEDTCCVADQYTVQIRSELAPPASRLMVAVVIDAAAGTEGIELPSIRFSDMILDLGEGVVLAVQGSMGMTVSDSGAFLANGDGELLMQTVLAELGGVPTQLVQVEITQERSNPGSTDIRRLQDSPVAEAPRELNMAYLIIAPRTLAAESLLSVMEVVSLAALQDLINSRSDGSRFGITMNSFRVDGLVDYQAGQTASTSTTSTEEVYEPEEVTLGASDSDDDDEGMLTTVLPVLGITVVTVAAIVGVVVVRRSQGGCVMQKVDPGEGFFLPVEDDLLPQSPKAVPRGVGSDMLRDAARAMAVGLQSPSPQHDSLAQTGADDVLPRDADSPPPPSVDAEPPAQMWRCTGPPEPPGVGDTPSPPVRQATDAASPESPSSSSEGAASSPAPRRARIQGASFGPPCRSRRGYKFCCCGCGPAGEGMTAEDSILPEWDISDSRSIARNVMRVGRTLAGEAASDAGTHGASVSGGLGVSEAGHATPRTWAATSGVLSPPQSARGSGGASPLAGMQDLPEVLVDELLDEEVIERPPSFVPSPGEASLRSVATESADVAAFPELPSEEELEGAEGMVAAGELAADDDDELLVAQGPAPPEAQEALDISAQAELATSEAASPRSPGILELSPIAMSTSGLEMSHDSLPRQSAEGEASETPTLDLQGPPESGRRWVFAPPPRTE